MSLDNKVVIVTGGSSGIGAAISIIFSREGAKVALVGRNETKLKQVVDQCENVGGKPLMIVGDVTKDEDVKNIINTTVNHFGKLDVLVNNVGITTVSNIMDENALQAFDEIMAVNLRPAVSLTNLAGPHLVATEGNIVNISSIAGIGVVASNNFAHSTSKAAMNHFTRCIALDFASKGVRCNVVNPGPVKTNCLQNMGMTEAEEDAGWQRLRDYTPLKRIGDSKEIAQLVLFLASDKAKGITGSSFVTDNRFLLKGCLGDF